MSNDGPSDKNSIGLAALSELKAISKDHENVSGSVTFYVNHGKVNNIEVRKVIN